MNEETSELNLREIYFILKKHIVLLIAISVVCALIAFLVTSFFIQPKYKADAMLVVNAGQSTASMNITGDQLNAAKQLVATCAVIMTSDSVLNQVIDNLGLQTTVEELRSGISITAVNSTVVMDVAVTDYDAQKAADIANELANVAPDILVRTVQAGSVKSVSPAKADNSPVSPNVKQNTMVAFVGGLVVAAVVAFLIESLNNTFTTEEDIRKYLNIPVLGVIPNLKK